MVAGKSSLSFMAGLLLVMPLVCYGISILSAKGDDTYTEELNLKRLRSHNILSQFRFVITSDIRLGPNYKVFPRIIAEVLNKYNVREFHLSLTQGFWRTAEWGIAPQPASPTGAQLYAWFDGNASTVDDRWNHFVNSLNGIFCTSLLEMVPLLTASPKFSFFPRGLAATTDSAFIRYGALTGETVCTENLTPWKKLLPCKHTGLSTLLHPIKLYESVFHSMSVHVTQVCKDSLLLCEERTRLELNLNVLSEVNLRLRSLNWSLRDLFGRQVEEKCTVADTSVIIFERDRKSVSIEEPTQKRNIDGRLFFIYNLSSLPKDSFPFNLNAVYKSKLDLKNIKPESLLSMHSYLGGTGQQSGRVITNIINRQLKNQRAVYAHIIPWFMRIYFYTIVTDCQSELGDKNSEAIVNGHNFVAGKDRKRPFLLEWDITLPANSICEFSFEFDKAFLRVSEFPPDANHGMYVPAAALTLLAEGDFWSMNRTAFGGYRTTLLDELSGAETSRVITMYGEALLVLLPVPDFSMPFNVICLVCTAMAMLFGPVHSLTTKMMIPIMEKDKDLAPKSLLGQLVAFIKTFFSQRILKNSKKEGEKEENMLQNMILTKEKEQRKEKGYSSSKQSGDLSGERFFKREVEVDDPFFSEQKSDVKKKELRARTRRTD